MAQTSVCATWNTRLRDERCFLSAALLWPILRSRAELFDLPRAGIPEQERYQLVSGASGYGVHELAEFLREQNETPPGLRLSGCIGGTNLYRA